MRKRMIAGLVALGVALGVAVAVPASAVLTGRTGTFSERQHFLRQNDPWQTTSGTFVAVPTAAQAVSWTSGNRLIDARFTAESQCAGTSGWCSVRIVIVNASGVVTELQPASGTDFAFDSSNSGGNDLWESHAIERSSYYLAPGSYRVLVQAAVVGSNTLRLDDWHLAVEVVRP